MKKIWNKSVLYFVIPICVGIITFIVYYGYPFKNVSSQDLRVYQLFLTALAATVGIGTVINSSRSAELSRKSIEITQSKESREQSSHLVTSSKLDSFKISPPMYKADHIYSPTMHVGKTLYDVLYERHDSLESFEKAKIDFKKSLINIQDERLDGDSKLNMIHLLNIGKGVCLNIEYEFKFENKEDFIDYSVVYDTDKQGKYDVVAPAFYPSYNLMVDNYKSHLKIITKDLTISYLTKQASMDDDEQYYYSVSEIIFRESQQKTYIPFLQPGKDIFLPVPNEFMILCNHYLIMSLYKKYEEESSLSKFIKPGIKHLIDGVAISPVGRVLISYMDEEDVRAINKEARRKELLFDVRIKDESIYKHDEDIYFYLEFTPTINSR